MPESDQPDPQKKAEETNERINQTVEKGETLVNTIAQLVDDLISTRSWKRRMVILSVVFALVLNPPVVQQLLGFFDLEDILPPQYLYFYWGLVLIPFVIAIVAAVRELREKRRKRPTVGYSDRSAIKGLQPFELEDHEIFRELGRDKLIREVKEALERNSYSIGVLIGLSGSGKTSFLRAGLIKALEEKSGQKVVYAQLSEKKPSDSVHKALEDGFDTNLIPGLIHALGELYGEEKHTYQSIVLLLDQFEQLYTHRRSEEDIHTFYEELKICCTSEFGPKVKILIAIRSDFQHHLYDLQGQLDFNLQPNADQNYFDLPLFKAEEAADVLRVIIENDGFTPDPAFIKEICEKELANEDGDVSAVNIQVLAKMISKNYGSTPQAFSKENYARVGGIDGIWEQFLRAELDSYSLFNQNQNSLKALLAFIDLENNVRAGFLTKAQLAAKLGGSVDINLQELLDHLQKVRLLTRDSAKEETDRYQLAHERLIFPLRIYANHEGVPSLKATQLLDRRTNEWLANRRDSRYLLPWREYRLIKRNEKALSYGKNPEEKVSYVRVSEQNIRRKGLWSSVAAVLLLLGAGWSGKSFLNHTDAENLLIAVNNKDIAENPSAKLMKIDSAAAWHWDQEQVFQAYLKEIQALKSSIQVIPFYQSAFELGTHQDTLVSLVLDFPFSSVLKSRNLYELGIAASRLRSLPEDVPIPDSIPFQAIIDTCLRWSSYETVGDMLWVMKRMEGKEDQVKTIAQQALDEIKDKPQWFRTRQQLSELAGISADLSNAYPRPDIVPVTGGTFQMGDEREGSYESTHSDFAIGKYEVTVGQYVDFLNRRHFLPEDSAVGTYLSLNHRQIYFQDTCWRWGAGQEAFPMVYVTWYGATAYANWLTEVTPDSFSLPTEAQWEFAAGGGLIERDSLGMLTQQYSGSDTVSLVGWVDGNSHGSSHPVGVLQANQLGLNDMSGNVWEWCSDWYGRYPSDPQQNYTGPDIGDNRVDRGGSWGYGEADARVTRRGLWNPDAGGSRLGFRLARLR